MHVQLNCEDALLKDASQVIDDSSTILPVSWMAHETGPVRKHQYIQCTVTLSQLQV